MGGLRTFLPTSDVGGVILLRPAPNGETTRAPFLERAMKPARLRPTAWTKKDQKASTADQEFE